MRRVVGEARGDAFLGTDFAMEDLARISWETDFTPELVEKPAHPPIRNEATNKLSNVRGTLGMARTEALRSATSQFFINVADNRAKLDHHGFAPEDFGYAVFGRVLSGLDVCDRIAAAPRQRSGPHDDVPIEPVVIKGVRVIQ